jgi:hypothetical protein
MSKRTAQADASRSRLVVHIGHAKTGSSAIQSFLALNVELLQEFGVLYPAPYNMNLAARGEVSIGNFKNFNEATPSSQRELYSSEFFYRQILQDSDFLHRLRELDPHATLICFTRNQFDHMLSSWGQCLKRDGETRTLEEFAANNILYTSVLACAKKIEASGLNLILLNYGNHRNNLESRFMDCVLGDASAEFMCRARRITHPVNRSLTPAECEIQRQYNRVFGKWAGQMISEPLLRHHPEIPSSPPRLPRKVLEKVADRNRDAGRELNRRLPPEEALDLDVPGTWVRDREHTDPLILSNTQIEILVEHTSRYIRPGNPRRVVRQDIQNPEKMALNLKEGLDLIVPCKWKRFQRAARGLRARLPFVRGQSRCSEEP